MSENHSHNSSENSAPVEAECSRRRFLKGVAVTSAAVTGGFALSIPATLRADENAAPAAQQATSPSPNLVLQIKEHGKLAQIGGSEVIEMAD
ncbi:MAG TPA: twin-arginine translocation signal domain-containing protein, partial [Abditibacteriaceae bacterium]